MNRKRIEKILHNCSKTIDESVNRVGASNEIVKYIKDLEQQCKKQKEVIDKAIEYIETCNPNVELHSEFLDESYLSNYGAKELLYILKEVK